ncbi:hypothetical protein DPMN_144226 [Dreissena polymorpha]|uniref:Uncharacterized protein n=1 Tax=Dreissena polymorpha TaxID=45954 RepID=A0A9D4GEL9_DREPO|nr:hypothetical protein DPMN_144118 [Dreissena polymorpha]KAH3815695.1 hypothetical protein DPMN_144226 [Dreissena polymorpha]
MRLELSFNVVEPDNNYRASQEILLLNNSAYVGNLVHCCRWSGSQTGCLFILTNLQNSAVLKGGVRCLALAA